MTSPAKIDTTTDASLGDQLFAALQYLLPKHALSRLIYHVTRSESPAIKRTLIANFLRGYHVNMAEAVQSDPHAYASFNAFFTRALRPDVRPIASEADAIVSPVDGAVSQCAPLAGESLIQAKGRYYTLQELLAGDAAAIGAFRNGSFACIYLAPFNYHRIHLPSQATLRSTVYAPGDLFSVNSSTARAVPRVFARNERLICDFDTPAGRMAVILIGALFVGSIETVHCGEVNPPPRSNKGAQWIATGVGRRFARGEELGRFNMGSTVILLFENGRVSWDAATRPLATVQMGRSIARMIPR
jgi:phosphatidylserine decarboxylase